MGPLLCFATVGNTGYTGMDGVATTVYSPTATQHGGGTINIFTLNLIFSTSLIASGGTQKRGRDCPTVTKG
jgi:hypothetical protein